MYKMQVSFVINNVYKAQTGWSRWTSWPI